MIQMPTFISRKTHNVHEQLIDSNKCPSLILLPFIAHAALYITGCKLADFFKKIIMRWAGDAFRPIVL